MINGIDRPPAPWSGREGQQGADHDRWFRVVNRALAGAGVDAEPGRSARSIAGAACIVGYCCDEGVRRNQGRIGTSAGPGELRRALASLAEPGLPVVDLGDVVVDGNDLESAQARLGRVVAHVLAQGGLPVVLGGGHDVAWGSSLGWEGSTGWGVLNVDAHLDLRSDPTATSGTPFRQLARRELGAGRPFSYAVVGVSRANNTRAHFATAAELGARLLFDDECTPEAITGFVGDFVAGLDRVHLTLDLDALPAAVAPGVSAPAGFGIALDAVRQVGRLVATSGKLGLLEVAELNPTFDVDARTARTAARLVDDILRSLP